MPDTAAPEMTPAEVALLPSHLWRIDARPRRAFAAGHLPGSLGIELTDDFGVWVGWLLPFNAPIVVVLDPDQDAVQAVTQLGRIGFERVRGVLRGVDGWRAAGNPLVSFETVDVDGMVAALEQGTPLQVLDVRGPAEWEAGHLDGSLHSYLPDLAIGVPEQLRPEQPVWVACASGYRSSIAAGLLERAGYRPIVLSPGGVPDLLDRQRAGQHAWPGGIHSVAGVAPFAGV